MKQAEALEIVKQTQAGDRLAGRRFLKIVDALRSQGFTHGQSAKLLKLEPREFDALIVESENEA